MPVEIAFILVTGSLMVRRHRRPDAYPMLVTGRRVLMTGVVRRVADEWVEPSPGVVRIVDERVAPSSHPMSTSSSTSAVAYALSNS